MSVVKRAIARLNALKQGTETLIVENDGDMPSARALVAGAAEARVKKSRPNGTKSR